MEKRSATGGSRQAHTQAGVGARVTTVAAPAFGVAVPVFYVGGSMIALAGPGPARWTALLFAGGVLGVAAVGLAGGAVVAVALVARASGQGGSGGLLWARAVRVALVAALLGVGASLAAAQCFLLLDERDFHVEAAGRFSSTTAPSYGRDRPWPFNGYGLVMWRDGRIMGTD